MPSVIVAFLRSLLVLLLIMSRAAAAPIDAPNVVPITPSLLTAGQPTAAALAGLAAQGFQAVVYLAPPTVADAVRDEAQIVARQGLVFVNIPIRFDQPTAQDFNAFAGVLRALEGRKVLVHCQINLRASSMVFLYRSIVLKEDPRRAFEQVSAVWSPDPVWKAYVESELARHGLRFETY